MIPAVAICRCSTDHQDISVESQKENIIKQFGTTHQLLDWYADDGYSGDDETRPEYQRFMAELARTDYVEILAWDLSRFSRAKPWKTMRDLEQIDLHDKQINTCKEGLIRLDDANEVVAYLHSFTSHKQLKTVAIDSLRGKVSRFELGELYGQTTPYGLARELIDLQGNKHVFHRTERMTKPKNWKQRFILGDSQEVDVIKWLFETFAKSDCSFRAMATNLNNRGIPSPNGKFWVYQTIIELLMNYRYCGFLTLGRDKAGKHARLIGGRPTPNKQTRMKTFSTDFLVSKEATHEGIVTWELFEFVQKKLAEKKAKTPQRRSYKEGGYALTGIVYCGRCRKPMYGTERKKDHHNKGGKAYYCKGKSDNPNACGCPQWRVEEPNILPLVIREAAKLIEKQMMVVREVLAEPLADRDAAQRRKLEKQQKKYEVAMRRFIKLEDDSLASELERELKRMKAEIESIEAQLRRAKDGGDLAAIVARVEQYAADTISFWTSTPDLRSAKDHIVRTADLRQSLRLAGLQVFVYFEKVRKRTFGSPLWLVSKVTMSLPDLSEAALPQVQNRGFPTNYGVSSSPTCAAECGNDTSLIV